MVRGCGKLILNFLYGHKDVLIVFYLKQCTQIGLHKTRIITIFNLFVKKITSALEYICGNCDTEEILI